MPQTQTAPDPWQEAAKGYKQQQGGAVQPSATQKPGEDWKIWQQGSDDAQPQTILQKIGSGALDLAKGAGEGVLNTVSSADDWSRQHLPAFMTNKNFGFGAPADLQRVHDLATPANTTQKIGKGVEQAAEFLLPTGVEEAGAKLGGEALGRAGQVLGRVGGAGMHAGAVNKVQGGTFTGGALAGAAGAGVGMGLKKIAPVLAETALKMRAPDRAYGRTPGEAILNETTGFTPGKIASQAADKVNQYSNDLESMARDSPSPMSLQPAREEATRSIDAAYGRNNKSTYDKLVRMGHQLDTDLDGNEIPETISPQQGLHLKRGIGDLQTSWNPATQPKWVSGQVGRVYHALDSELDRALPGGADLNQKISSLMPVEQRANAEDLNAGLLQRIHHRFGSATGALVGGAAGYHFGGVPGAVAGLIGPELLSNPTTLMMEARALNSPAIGKIAIPAAVGAGAQVFRPDPDDESQEPQEPKKRHAVAPVAGGPASADDEQSAIQNGYRAMDSLPAPLQRIGAAMNPQLTIGKPQKDSRGNAVVANVEDGNPYGIEINDPKLFAKDPATNMSHEMTHQWQASLPPSMIRQIPEDSADPDVAYDISDADKWRKQGQTLATIPRERAATIVERYAGHPEERQRYQPWIDDMAKTPLSTTMPTPPDDTVMQKIKTRLGMSGLNMTPRAPGVPLLDYSATKPAPRRKLR